MPNRFGIWHIKFECPKLKRGYPFFLRLKNGHIFYPPRVEGWYWNPEVEAAIQTGFTDYIHVVEGWTIEQSDVRPYYFVPGVFEHRKRLKAEGKDGAQNMLKLGVNSLYGKMAQTVGGELGKPPPYHEFVWAGYTTSKTRATVFETAMQNPDAVCYIATDGIGSTEPLQVKEGKELGEWECKQWEQALLIQAGVYFLVGNCGECDKCKGNKEWWIHEKYRGFDKGSIHPLAVIQGWKDRVQTIPVPSTRFITLGTALTSDKWWGMWRQWRTINRELDLWGGGGKRIPYSQNDKPDRGLCYLQPTDFTDIKLSARFPVKWLEESWEEPTIDGVKESTFFQEQESEGS